LYKTVGDFKCVSQTGDTITQAVFDDKIWVADVFFTTCTSICPKLSKGLSTVQDYFKNDDEVKFLSISVDPETDSVPVLRAYADEYGAIDNKWYMVTGNKNELFKFAHEEFFFSATEDEDKEIKFVHDNTLRLVDKEGRFRGMFYDGTNQFEVDSLISHIKLLKLEYAQNK
jgi:protein SCO1/2